jgi:vacuolar-type H+-ATPase subunit I/STV1
MVEVILQWVMLIIYVATVTVECRMAIKVLFLYIKWKLICHVLLHPYSFLLQVNNNKITVFYFVFRSFSQDTKATRMSPVCRVHHTLQVTRQQDMGEVILQILSSLCLTSHITSYNRLIIIKLQYFILFSGALAKTLRQQECPQYAGFCCLAQARLV